MPSYQDEWKLRVPGHEEIRRLHETLRDEVRARWRRSLPFADEMFDRWERAAHLGFGAGTSIYDASLVFGDVQVGEHTWIGPFTVLDGTGGLVIGSHCDISAGAQLYTHDSMARCITAGRAPVRRAPVRVGSRTYLGPGTIVSAGVTIGEGCVIGAGALVNQDVPDGAIALGTPARVVGRVVVNGDEVELVYD